MAEFRYLDFELLIERTTAQYRARVVASPAGEARAEFAPPPAGPGDTLAGLQRQGGALFRAVFTGPIARCFAVSKNTAAAQGAGLRIRLRLNDAPELAGLPWETLYDVELDRFLALSAETPLVRSLELGEPPRSLAVQPPIGILVVIASPADLPQLDTAAEWAKLQAALAQLTARKLVTLERLAAATLPALQARLRRGACHILHFIGHGAFDEGAQDGVLMVEDDAGRSRAVSGGELGMLLHDHAALRLAVLNACEGAVSAQADPFGGVAPALMRCGLPAVVAMRSVLSDAAAKTFTQGFYAALADFYPVDAALVEARKAMYTGVSEVEWATPVLHLRAADGILWRAPEEKPMPDSRASTSWERELAAGARGDVIIATLGNTNKNVAVGKQISQIIQEGAPGPGDRQVIEQKLAAVTAALSATQGQLDVARAMMADFQLKLLAGELVKTEESAVPSASTITQVGDWLLDNVPQIAEALTSLFATPAVGKVVGKAGEAAAQWARRRFGSQR